jgi:PTH2 family peptidyl-tRNA hydrolase
MSEGKTIAQAGHAFLDAILKVSPSSDPYIHHARQAYLDLSPGTKITLDGGSLAEMEVLIERLALAGIPHIPIIDEHHVELPDFDGSPVLTAIGVGPLFRDQSPGCLRRLPLWKGRTPSPCATRQSKPT